MSPLIDIEDLSVDAATGRVLEPTTGRPVRILDVRWRLDSPEGRPAYLEGHLPGAVYVDLEHELSWHGHPEQGRHPLPSETSFAQAVHRWGIHDGDPVVIYDDIDGVAASRAWWLLRQYGIAARVLDGGFRAWVAAGLRLESGDRVVKAGTARVHTSGSGILSIDEAAAFPRHGTLVDVRGLDHYRGLRTGADPVAGHIPGAISIPTVSHIAPDGRFRSPAAISATLAAHGIGPGAEVAVYCSSGVASTHSVLAYHLAGVRALLFPGSWSQWSRSPGRPSVVGMAPYGQIRTV